MQTAQDHHLVPRAVGFSTKGLSHTKANMTEHEKTTLELIPQQQQNWQSRPEWFFNREHTDTYEQWYEGRYKRAEVWQKKVMEQLVSTAGRVHTLLEFGCGTTRVSSEERRVGKERVSPVSSQCSP